MVGPKKKVKDATDTNTMPMDSSTWSSGCAL